jgi:hypothetical protein
VAQEVLQLVAVLLDDGYILIGRKRIAPVQAVQPVVGALEFACRLGVNALEMDETENGYAGEDRQDAPPPRPGSYA